MAILTNDSKYILVLDQEEKDALVFLLGNTSGESKKKVFLRGNEERKAQHLADVMFEIYKVLTN